MIGKRLLLVSHRLVIVVPGSIVPAGIVQCRLSVIERLLGILDLLLLRIDLALGAIHSILSIGLRLLGLLERILSIRKAHGGRVDYGLLRPREGVLRILERLSSRIMRLLGLFLDGVGLLLVRGCRIECGLCRFELFPRPPELLARIRK